MKREIALVVCLAVFALSIGSVLFSPRFSSWGMKQSAEYYIAEGLSETRSPNIVNAIVWDFRAFDTLGEEIVLFTAAVGVFTVMVFGISEKGREKEKIRR